MTQIIEFYWESASWMSKKLYESLWQRESWWKLMSAKEAGAQ